MSKIGGGIAPQQLVNNQSQLAAAAAQKKGGAQGSTGTIAGRNISQAKTPQSLLDSAEEELTSSLESKSSDDFAIKERKKEDSSADGSRLKEIESYAEVMDDDNHSAKLEKLTAFLRGRTDPDEALSQALKEFSNKTDAWAALTEIAQKFGDEQAPELQTVLSALEKLESEFGTEIKAGLRGALNSTEYKDIGSAAQLRNLYTDTVIITTTPESILARLMEEYGEDSDLDRAIDFLFATLGSDMAASDPSADPAELKNLMGSLEKTQQLHSSHKLCMNALQRWKGPQGGGGKNDTLTPLEMMKQLIALRNETFVSSFDIESIAKKGDPQDIEKEVLLLQEILMAVRKFPILVFDNQENRTKVLAAAQEALDEAVQREDEILYQKEHPDVDQSSKPNETTT